MLGLYAWGANSHGQLGLGYTCEMVCDPLRVDELPAQLCESAIATIVGGGGHSLLLSVTGTLYGAGWNHCGQVGDGTASRCVPFFRECRGLEDQVITAVSCGWAHTVACSSSGHVWVWGSNSHGQLGLPPNEVPFSCLPICLEMTDVVSVAAGLRHTVIATRGGDVYTWGHGHRGQLGHLTEDGVTQKICSSPKIVDSLESKVVSVCCGQNMTYALTDEGALLAWGDNKWGQLAHDPRNLLFFTCPLVIPSNYFGCERVEWIRVGWTHCVARTSSGQVYTWGRSDYGQLGPSDDIDTMPMIGREEQKQDTDVSLSTKNLPEKFRFIPSLVTVAEGFKISQLECGSEHTLVLLSKTEGLTTQPNAPHSHYKSGAHFFSETCLKSKNNSLKSLVSNLSSNFNLSESTSISDSNKSSSLDDSHLHSSNINSPLAKQSPEVPCCNPTDSGTVSSASDSGSAHLDTCPNKDQLTTTLSYSPPSSDPLVQDKLNLDETKTSPHVRGLLFKLQDRDEPFTLSPIDSPRTLPSSVLHSCSFPEVPIQEVPTIVNKIDQPTIKKADVSDDYFPAIYSWGWNEHGNCGLGTVSNVFIPQRIKTEGRVELIGAGSGHSFALIRNYSKISL